MARELDHAEAFLLGLLVLLNAGVVVAIAVAAWHAPLVIAGVVGALLAAYVVGRVIQWLDVI